MRPCHSIPPARTAPHCNTLHHTATHCNTLQHTATHCNTLQHTATHVNTTLAASQKRNDKPKDMINHFPSFFHHSFPNNHIFWWCGESHLHVWHDQPGREKWGEKWYACEEVVSHMQSSRVTQYMYIYIHSYTHTYTPAFWCGERAWWREIPAAWVCAWYVLDLF